MLLLVVVVLSSSPSLPHPFTTTITKQHETTRNNAKQRETLPSAGKRKDPRYSQSIELSFTEIVAAVAASGFEVVESTEDA